MIEKQLLPVGCVIVTYDIYRKYINMFEWKYLYLSGALSCVEQGRYLQINDQCYHSLTQFIVTKERKNQLQGSHSKNSQAVLFSHKKHDITSPL